MSTGKPKARSGWKEIAGVGCVLVALGWLVGLFSPHYSTDSRPIVDTSVRTPYVTDLADRLRKDPVYVDPVLADTVGKDLVTPEVREAVENSELATYLLVIPDLPGGSAQTRVLLTRIADELDEQAVFFALDQNRLVTDHVHKSDAVILDREFGTQTPETMLDTVEDAADHVDGEEQDLAFDVLNGLLLGTLLSVLLWNAVRFVRWTRRRNRSYLTGFER
ncbi:MAG TPA: hypothetical protein VIR30_00590 [Nocardioides sp.]